MISHPLPHNANAPKYSESTGIVSIPLRNLLKILESFGRKTKGCALEKYVLQIQRILWALLKLGKFLESMEKIEDSPEHVMQEMNALKSMV